MKITDELWVNVWSKYTQTPISTAIDPGGISNEVCDASFAYAMDGNFREGMTLLDYGCGSARFCNFVSKKLKNFTYYGLEKRSSSVYWGELEIQCAKSSVGHDPRVKLGFIDTDMEKEAIDNADTVLLLSIFTHASIEETRQILEKLLPIAKRGGKIVFSMIHGKEYALLGENMYGFPNFYRVTANTEQQVRDLATELQVSIVLQDTFLTSDGFPHSIYSLTL